MVCLAHHTGSYPRVRGLPLALSLPWLLEAPGSRPPPWRPSCVCQPLPPQLTVGISGLPDPQPASEPHEPQAGWIGGTTEGKVRVRAWAGAVGEAQSSTPQPVGEEESRWSRIHLPHPPSPDAASQHLLATVQEQGAGKGGGEAVMS